MHKSSIIGTEHLLLGVLRDDENLAAQILQQKYRITYENMRRELKAHLSGRPSLGPSKHRRGMYINRETNHATAQEVHQKNPKLLYWTTSGVILHNWQTKTNWIQSSVGIMKSSVSTST